MTSKEKTAHLAFLGKAIADILTTQYNSAQRGVDGVWEYVPPTEDDSCNVYLLQRGTGARIYLQLYASVGYEKIDRVQVSGWFHIGKNGTFVEVRDNNVRIYPTISCGLSRNPEAIAKDIAKRFLPEYLPAFERALEIVANEEAYELRIKNTLGRVANAARFTVPKPGPYDREVRREVSGKIGGKDVTIKVYDGRVELKLDDLTIEEAESIIDRLQYLTR